MDFKKIKNIKQAFKALGRDYDNLPEFLDYPEHLRAQKRAEYVLETGIEAINGPEWDGKYDDPEQAKYYPWFRVVDDSKRASGRGLSFYVFVFANVFASVAPRLTYESREKAIHGAKVLKAEYEAVYLRQ